MEPRREISLTQSELLAAQIEALGLSGAGSGTLEDRIYDAMVNLIHKYGRRVSGREIGDEIGAQANTVNAALNRMAAKGRVVRDLNPDNSRTCYLPVVTKG